MSLPKILFSAAVVTAAATVANHWPVRVDTTVRSGNHAPDVTRDCGPGPRVLILGGSVANGWGASDMAHEWWVLACQRVGGTWRNVAVPAARVADELRQYRAAAWDADVVIALDGANDLVLGLAPQIRGQIEHRVEVYRAGVAALRREIGPRLVVIAQPLGLGKPALQTVGHEAELAAAYARMRALADVDLGGLEVDFRDLTHFGDVGQVVVAGAVVRDLRAATGRVGEP